MRELPETPERLEERLRNAGLIAFTTARLGGDRKGLEEALAEGAELRARAPSAAATRTTCRPAVLRAGTLFVGLNTSIFARVNTVKSLATCRWKRK